MTYFNETQSKIEIHFVHFANKLIYIEQNIKFSHAVDVDISCFIYYNVGDLLSTIYYIQLFCIRQGLVKYTILEEKLSV